MSTLLEKREKIVIYLQHYTDLHKIWHDDAEHLSRARAVKKSKSKMADGRYVWETRS